MSIQSTLAKKLNLYYPGGHSNFRAPYDVTQHRTFMSKAKGSRVWDIDNNEYVEYCDAYGPTILGHGHTEYVNALKDLLDTSTSIIGSNVFFSEDDITAAEAIIKHVPCAEQIKFNVTGSESVQMAIRIARAYTGKDRVIRFANHYHGWFDNILGGVINTDKTKRPTQGTDIANDSYYSAGRSPWSLEESFILPWNDFQQLEKTIVQYHNEIAIVHFEPMACNHFGLYPKPGFLEKIRELCTQYNIIMSMDEVITGFRLGLGGAQKYFKITPDICTLAKSIGGGIPVSCVAGKKEFMSVLKKHNTLSPGTFNGYALGMRAVLTTINILERNNGACYKKRAQLQETLINGLLDIAKEKDIPMRISEAPGVFFTILGASGGLNPIYTSSDCIGWDPDMFLKFRTLMHKEGVMILLGGRWYMSMAHTQEDVNWTLQAADKAMSQL